MTLQQQQQHLQQQQQQQQQQQHCQALAFEWEDGEGIFSLLSFFACLLVSSSCTNIENEVVQQA